MKVDFNECWYSCGADNPHNDCTHQNYCIFNDNRTLLESMINDLEIELGDVENQLTQYHQINTARNYNELMKQKTLITTDLEELRHLRNQIIDKEVREYGYGLLES